MATLNKNSQFEGSLTLTKASGTTINLSTSGTYVDRDINFTLGVRNASTYSLDVTSLSGNNTVRVGTLSNGNYPIIADNISVTAKLTAGISGWFTNGSATDNDTDGATIGTMAAATITYTGGELINRNSTAVGTNAKLESTNTSGIKIQTKNTVGRAALTYTNTAGYLPATSSATNASNAINASTQDGTAYYLTGVKLTAGKSFIIDVPNGTANDRIQFRFTVNADGTEVNIDQPETNITF